MKIDIKIDRKFIYMLILLWYYTLVTVYSINLGFFDVLGSVTVVTLVSYGWIVKSASSLGAYYRMDFLDLVLNVFVYSFVSFYVTFMTIIISPYSFDTLKILVMLTPIPVWTMIWFDFYIQKVTGRW